ncbi:DNA cytosine methyltransferase [Pseudotenacibaculum haliotis]|uniref:Cytosine-specific methyltransferase n=1 Tax=Pseudotenacibaculum haliotis TaxID=1862138 RepID=A0ABW5LV44_9FLAO
MSTLKFIDLFAGIGGFHIALEKLDLECVFASELKESLAGLYKENFGITPNRDITKVAIEDIPKHDILCAGFPCQPFSKAGSQKGLLDERNGSLFDKIVDILDYHKPEYFILENVRNLESHDNGNTWNYIQNRLQKELNYSIDKHIFSPHHFGIPQHRERFFIVGSKNGLEHFTWPETINEKTSIFNFLDNNPTNATKLEPEKIHVLDLWQEFLDRLPKNAKIPSWPIWSMEFGATYPFENTTPYASSTIAIGKTKGNFGVSLKGMSREEKFNNLPSYARTEQNEFPTWKKHYIRSNRKFYADYKEYIDPVLKKIKALNVPSWQKFEWNVQGGERTVRNYIIQFRGSGVRLKKTDFFPSLVTVSTQIPILGWQERYITPREGARIQSMNGISLPENKGACFSALGNAVNVKIVKKIAEKLILKKTINEEKVKMLDREKPVLTHAETQQCQY